GHGGRRAPEIHLGLGKGAMSADVTVEIGWRDERGSHLTIRRLAIDRRHRIVLGVDATAADLGGAAVSRE
ncbi:MAG: hypothetical protein WCE79_18865, partial [Xanthobacteraceae bacterium]